MKRLIFILIPALILTVIEGATSADRFPGLAAILTPDEFMASGLVGLTPEQIEVLDSALARREQRVLAANCEAGERDALAQQTPPSPPPRMEPRTPTPPATTPAVVAATAPPANQTSAATPSSPPAAQISERPPTPTSASTSGDWARFGQPATKAKDEVQVMPARVISRSGREVYQLDNGQVWKSLESTPIDLVGRDVTIEPGNFGAFVLRVRDTRFFFRVTRIR